TCPLCWYAAAIAILFRSVIHVRYAAHRKQECKRQPQFLIIVISEAKESISVMIVYERDQMVHVLIFIILIKNRLYCFKTGIMCKHFTGLEEQREVENAPLIL